MDDDLYTMKEKVLIESERARFNLFINGFLSEKYNKVLKKRLRAYMNKNRINISFDDIHKEN